MALAGTYSQEGAEFQMLWAPGEEGFRPSCPSPLAEALPSPEVLRSLALNYSASTQRGLLLSLPNEQTRAKQAR